MLATNLPCYLYLAIAIAETGFKLMAEDTPKEIDMLLYRYLIQLLGSRERGPPGPAQGVGPGRALGPDSSDIILDGCSSLNCKHVLLGGRLPGHPPPPAGPP